MTVEEKMGKVFDCYVENNIWKEFLRFQVRLKSNHDFFTFPKELTEEFKKKCSISATSRTYYIWKKILRIRLTFANVQGIRLVVVTRRRNLESIM